MCVQENNDRSAWFIGALTCIILKVVQKSEAFKYAQLPVIYYSQIPDNYRR